MNLNFLKKFKISRDSISYFVIALVVVVLIGGSYWLGFLKGIRETKKIVVEGVTNPQKEGIDFSLFWEAWNVLKSKYVSQEKVSDDRSLLYGSIAGLLSSLKDPNTSFFSPEDAEKFSQDISGEFGGIGAEIGLNKDGQLIVITPLKGTPAEKAGLKPQDKILKINNENTFGLSVEEAVRKIRGPKGTVVTLTIFREGWEKEKDFSITRDIIQIPTLDFKTLNFEGKEDKKGKIAYIKLNNFYEKAPSLFYQAALKAIFSQAEGIILDLRNNPGGYLEAAVNIGGWFIEKGKTIVVEEFRDKSQNETFVSRGPSIFKDVPTVVLINKGSASASEILAGALKENNGAIIMGEKSFGKGTVQELVNLSDQSMLKITVAYWLTPQGHRIDQNGIEPDIELKSPQENEKEEFDTDSWIKEATQVLVKKIKGEN
ncbi:MAG: peptidase S41 [Candidatus Parcubacteria bacterium]|nr:MAG: peptidase S41 [Candidatus Parcubacteria bacterium]